MVNTYSLDKLLRFLDETPSRFHVVAYIKNVLQSNGFTELNALNAAALKPAGKYFITKNASSLIAFTLPQNCPEGFLITASHSDSPTFRIKENAELMADPYMRLNVERYGGMICSTWLDRPLSVAGRLLCDDGGGVRSVLVNIDRDALLIPNMPIHMNPKVNDGFQFKANVDMVPMFSLNASEGAFMDAVCEAAGVGKDAVLGTDLYLYNREKASNWGINKEFVSAGRLDDLQCAYSTLCAFLNNESAPNNHALVYMLSDNEEIGSETKQGAGSTFLKDALLTIAGAFNKPYPAYSAMLQNSFMLSCDNAHAAHPNHPEMSDQSNKPRINGGIVIKYGVRYATDGVAEAIVKRVCRHADVPYQAYSNRSDFAGGSTLGNISATQVALNTADIGLAQLAMHSSYETAGAYDTEYLVKAAADFYAMSLVSGKDGEYAISWKD